MRLGDDDEASAEEPAQQEQNSTEDQGLPVLDESDTTAAPEVG